MRTRAVGRPEPTCAGDHRAAERFLPLWALCSYEAGVGTMGVSA